MHGSAFAAWVRRELVPELRPGTVVIRDSPSTQRNLVAAEALRLAGCRFLYLRPYSPERNPDEPAFSTLKAPLHRLDEGWMASIWCNIL
ncbi:transposase [Roseovarius sp. TE539]|uniref:transposase n=1 Tax=Roseovarius sp. TE539 TaxID=2249812 RepID=UPI000DDC5FEE|nr:transposase [Roseovarius sp. TE539]